jgi:serine/threonine protein kinase
MMLLNHPHIVYLREMAAGIHYYYFTMDYVSGGQLLHYIVKRDHLTEKHARHFCRQMVSALDYMHRNSIVHRDLKIENILVDHSGRNIKIIDFGLSNLFCPERQLTTYCGSLYFAAPELLNGRPYRGPEIDVWSLGVVLYVMVTGSVPFDDKSLPGLHEKIKRAQVAYPAHMSTQCHHLLSHIFVAEPQQRITLADIIRHVWLNEGRSGYVRNHLPFREPLCLPLDEQVLERMTYGFNLGSIEDIRMKMQVILQSSVYRVSAMHVSEMQAFSLAGNDQETFKSRHQCLTKKNQISSNTKATNHMIWGSYNDPQTVPAAYHPLLSIYYLTRERMIRLEKASPPLDPSNALDIYPKHQLLTQQSNRRHVSSSSQHEPHTAPAACIANNSRFTRHSIDSPLYVCTQVSDYHQYIPSPNDTLSPLSSPVSSSSSLKTDYKEKKHSHHPYTHRPPSASSSSSPSSSTRSSLSFSSSIMQSHHPAAPPTPPSPKTASPPRKSQQWIDRFTTMVRRKFNRRYDLETSTTSNRSKTPPTLIPSSTEESILSTTTAHPKHHPKRHERTPSWLARRLSAWMDHAPLLNRSTSGLDRAKRS